MPRGVRSRKPHSAVHIRSAVADGLLACSLAARGAVVNTLDHTAHVRSRCPGRCLHNIEQTVGSYRIRSHRTQRDAVHVGRSPDRKTDRSRHIAVAEDSRHAVFAPEPAGAGRNVLDEELRRSWPGCTPCCQSNGRRGSAVACMLQNSGIRRAAFNGSNEGALSRSRLGDRLLLRGHEEDSSSCAGQHGLLSSVPSFALGLRLGEEQVVVSGADR
jgi:hypothetical protein